MGLCCATAIWKNEHGEFYINLNHYKCPKQPHQYRKPYFFSGLPSPLQQNRIDNGMVSFPHNFPYQSTDFSLQTTKS